MSAGSTRLRGLSISSNATARGPPHDDPSGILSEEEEDDYDGGNSEIDTHSRRSREPHASVDRDELDDDDDGEEIRSAPSYDEDLITVKARQSLINVEHPFGLPIWKPALYKKSRTVTRNAEEALHSIPSAQAERHLLFGNIVWTVLFGWWLSLVFLAVSAVLYFVPRGGRNYATLVFGLGWYIFWPFGKYLEGELALDSGADDEEQANGTQEEGSGSGNDSEDTATPRGNEAQSNHSTVTQRSVIYQQRVSAPSIVSEPNEGTSLLTRRAIVDVGNQKSYGAVPAYSTTGLIKPTQRWLGKLCFWLFLLTTIVPLLFIVCIICYAFVFTIPMARLNWALIKHLIQHPTSVRFCSAPAIISVSAPVETEGNASEGMSAFTIKSTRLSAGQLAPSGSPTSTVLLCIYKATGWQYYKYTIGGVNILFINLIPVVFLVILDGMFLLPWVEGREAAGKHVPAFIALLASRALIFILCLASVIPLSYFIGMAVASISAQSSIGMGAVINATFGSIIEILLYAIALTEGKGRLVEGSIVGSLLAGVLLMPGMSMCGGAVRRKEQKFNAKSAGVTSMMLMMAFIGTLTPTLFYQTYGTVSFHPRSSPQPLFGY
jgi:Ca2+:H+ antiporter